MRPMVETRYATTMAALRQRIDNPDLTPSAQVLAAAREAGGYFKYAKQMAAAAPCKLAG